MQFFSNVWYGVIALGVALAYAGALYYKNRRDELSKGWRISLACLRFGFVFLVCFLLFSPLVRLRRERIQKPVCLIALDQSFSMRGAVDSALLQKTLLEFSSRLSAHFNVQAIGFGLTIGPADFVFGQPATDFSRVFEHIGQQVSPQDQAAVVLVSDGNNNMGMEASTAYRKTAFPLYTVGVGDTNRYPDLFISQVTANRYAYRGNRFPIRIRVGQNRAPKSHSRLRLIGDFPQTGLLRDTLILFQDKKEQTVEWLIPADSAGECLYIVQLDPLDQEHDTHNNRQAFSVNVLENRQKILILAHAPHPDISCISQSLRQHEKYQMDVLLAKDLPSLRGNPARMKDYDLIILHGLPSLRHPLHEIKDVLDSRPVFYLLSGSTQLSMLNYENAGLRIRPRRQQWNEAQAGFSPDFALFQMSGQDRTLFSNLPPLQTPFATISTLEGGQSLFTQTVLGVPTSEPLLWFAPRNIRPTAVCAGTQLWKWRIADFQENGNTSAFDLLLDRCVQLLCQAKPDENLSLNCPASLHTTDNLRVEAQLYNAAFERVQDATIHFTLTEQESKAEYVFAFLPEDGHYVLDAGFLPAGRYRYRARAQTGAESYIKEGFLSITDRQLENPGLPANLTLLQNLALNYGGRSFYAGSKNRENPEVWNELAQELLHRKDLKSIIKTEDAYLSPLARTWILALLLGLLCLEYFARKRFGNL